MPVPPLPTAVVASFALIAITAVAAYRSRLGPHADWVEVVRSVTLPILDPVIERHVGGVGSVYQLGEREFVGHLADDVEVVEWQLWQAGCRRNVMAAYKQGPDGRSEAGSWVYRGQVVPDRKQIHVMLFESEGGTDVYAHMEYSSALKWLLEDRSVLLRHYAGRAYSPEAGVEFVRIHLLDGLRE